MKCDHWREDWVIELGDATIVAGEDINDGPPGGAVGGSDSGHHSSWRRCRWRTPLGVLAVGPASATTVVGEGVNGGPAGGAAGGSDSSHHHSCRLHRWRPLGGAAGGSGSGQQHNWRRHRWPAP
jgi:hypothetical protein